MSVIKDMVDAINAKVAEVTDNRDSLLTEVAETHEGNLNDNLAALDSMKAQFDKAEADRADAAAGELKAAVAQMEEKLSSFKENADEDNWNDIAQAYALIVSTDNTEDAGIISFGDDQKAALETLSASIGNADDVAAIFDAA